MDKRCPECRETKTIDNFSFDRSRKDGRRPWCKTCVKTYHDNHLDDFAKNNKKYSQTEGGKKIIANIAKIQRKKYPEKAQARDFVNHSISAGKILPAHSFTCFVCNKNQAKDYHHINGYSRENWLNVVPACRACHKIVG